MTEETAERLNQRYPVLRYFEHAHLPLDLRPVAVAFYNMAWDLAETLPYTTETSAGLRKLLEAKDCMVRASLEVVREVRSE